MKSNFTITNSRTNSEIVDLEFLIDVNGNPEKIKVTNSANTVNNAKAIDLLKNGLKWTNSINGKKQKAKVSIKL